MNDLTMKGNNYIMREPTHPQSAMEQCGWKWSLSLESLDLNGYVIHFNKLPVFVRCTECIEQIVRILKYMHEVASSAFWTSST